MSQELKSKLLESVRYDPETGELFWKERPDSHFASEGYCRRWNARFVGQPAFASINGAGYKHGSFSGSYFLAHRVAYLVHTGDWPECEIDHTDRNRTNNKWDNLRDATAAENKVNRPKVPGCKSMHVGVSQTPSGGWVAYLASRGNHKHLGTYGCETAAAVARKRAAQTRYGGFA